MQLLRDNRQSDSDVSALILLVASATIDYAIAAEADTSPALLLLASVAPHHSYQVAACWQMSAPQLIMIRPVRALSLINCSGEHYLAASDNKTRLLTRRTIFFCGSQSVSVDVGLVTCLINAQCVSLRSVCRHGTFVIYTRVYMRLFTTC